ncbi:hypothetical protein H310_00029 [Aphanomyces invadans]|uniref:THIF-type NAD/FAD binding fold domain-containing protein n=1 Tax=Aphanomyces invadans TaxID=157072 RepID=A0A024USF9_9STRA|nr:hypothetical protein H310_00029 [Aphanomyces invadans]ETW09421.1 hypothetical protein H310_00029 [Aphanomyces invadans]|eukprot:XP_008860832.1 hypothetical protein H310_00029 [Aphanomyces invadans]
MASSFAALPSADVELYSRQLLVKDFGVKCQKKLLECRVLVVGAGGLGCPVLLYLSGMGVGHLGIVDGDYVDLSNLHRQVLHTPAKVGQLKVESARAAVLLRSPSIQVEVFPVRMDASNAVAIMESYDVVVDASDNVATRYLVNDMCCLLHKPLVSGSALGLEGQVSVFNFHGGPCYRCCFPTPMPQTMAGSCSDQGVLGVVPGIIGSLQAMEAVKVVSGLGRPLSGVQCSFDAWDMAFRHFKLPSKRDDCAVCGTSPTIRSAMDSAASVGPLVCELPSVVDPSHTMNWHPCSKPTQNLSSSTFESACSTTFATSCRPEMSPLLTYSPNCRPSWRPPPQWL